MARRSVGRSAQKAFPPPMSKARTDQQIKETVESVYSRRDEIERYLKALERAQQISHTLLHLEIGV